MSKSNIFKNPVHLGLGATAVVQPEMMGGMEWYMEYGKRTEADGAEGRLVNLITFTESWKDWEVHPNGDELVLCTAGSITLHQEKVDGTKATVTLGPGEYIVNEPGTWHTADIEDTATALFITAGLGTEGRPR